MPLIPCRGEKYLFLGGGTRKLFILIYFPGGFFKGKKGEWIRIFLKFLNVKLSSPPLAEEKVEEGRFLESAKNTVQMSKFSFRLGVPKQKKSS